MGREQEFEAMTDVDPMLAVYRHDVHKLRMRSHGSAADNVFGARVNEPVPCGADGDAALLSRPAGKPEQTVDNHESPYRRSLLTGELARATAGVSGSAFDSAVREMVEITDPVAAHAWWVTSEIPALVNESVYYPYTSLKYHTLLAAAVLDNYRAGVGFEELFVAVTPSGADSEIVPHRTVLAMPSFALHVTGDPGDRPAARLGAGPVRSFADVWARLPEYPFDVGSTREWRVLDAQLRRIRSWSTALQFIEEFVAAFTSVTPVASGAVLGGESHGV